MDQTRVAKKLRKYHKVVENTNNHNEMAEDAQDALRELNIKGLRQKADSEEEWDTAVMKATDLRESYKKGMSE